MALVGYMGSGKSTVGRILADKLGRDFVDLDEEITHSEGRTIPEIFSKSGEAYFREVEHRELRRALGGDVKRIIACGGGIVLREDNRTLLGRATTVFLEEDVATLYERTRDGERPLRGADREQFEQRYAQRLALYKAVADLEVAAGGRSSEEVAEEVLRWWSA